MFTDNFKSRARVIRELGEQIARLTRERDDARAQRDRLNEANAAFAAQLEQQATTLEQALREKREAETLATLWQRKAAEVQAELARLKGQDGTQKPAGKRKGKEG